MRSRGSNLRPPLRSLQVVSDDDSKSFEGNERRLAYPSHNGFVDIVLALACPLAEIVEVPIDYRLGDHAIAEIRLRSGGKWLDVDEQEEVVWTSYDESCRPNDVGASESHADNDGKCKIDPNEPALVLWTSGTTGRPKGVVLSHANLAGNAAAKLAAVPQSHDDIRLTTLPLCHAYARTCDFGTWLLSGCTLAIGSGFQGWQTLGRIVNPTLANTVPSLAERLFATSPESIGIKRLRLLGCGGAAMRPGGLRPLAKTWRDRHTRLRHDRSGTGHLQLDAGKRRTGTGWRPRRRMGM